MICPMIMIICYLCKKLLPLAGLSYNNPLERYFNVSGQMHAFVMDCHWSLAGWMGEWPMNGEWPVVNAAFLKIWITFEAKVTLLDYSIRTRQPHYNFANLRFLNPGHCYHYHIVHTLLPGYPTRELQVRKQLMMVWLGRHFERTTVF